MRFMIVSDHSEHVSGFAYLDIPGGLEIFNKTNILLILSAPNGRHKMSVQ